MISTIFLFSSLILAASLNNIPQLVSAVGQVMAGTSNSEGDTDVHVEGSGVVVGPEGIVATNLHVISEGNKAYSSIYFNLIDPEHPFSPPDRSHLYRTEIVLEDSAYDLVLLRIVADADGRTIDPKHIFNSIPLGDSKSLNFLDEVYALGFPKAGGSTVTVTRGQISGKDELEDWIKIDAQVTHGSSGGAIVNSDGKLIGIPTMVRPDIQMIDTDNDGFPDTTITIGTVGLVRPVELVARMLDQFHSGKSGDLQKLAQPQRLQVIGEVVGDRGEPVTKALVGLLKAGSREASLDNLLTWTRVDEAGKFQFPTAVPPGPYTLRIRAYGYEIFVDSIELTPENHHLLVKLKRLGATEPTPTLSD